jgi:hypothetical protein
MGLCWSNGKPRNDFDNEMTMATLKQLSNPTAADFYDQYGPLAAPLREALGFEGQNDVDMLAPSRIDPMGGSDSGQGASLHPSAALQAMIDAGQVQYGNLQNHDPSAQDAMGYWVNWDKLPKTAYGSPGAVGISGYDPSMAEGMFNRNNKVKDPNFGWITPTNNLDHELHGMDSFIYNAAPAIAIAMMTMGAGIPSMYSQGMGATRMASQIGSGDFDPMSLLPIVGSALGLPPLVTQGASTLAQVARGRRPNPLAAAGTLINAVGPGG